MHSPDATWETGLVIPETAKPIDVQTLDALLRIEALLTELLGRNETIALSAATVDMIEEVIAEAPKPPKGKRK